MELVISVPAKGHSSRGLEHMSNSISPIFTSCFILSSNRQPPKGYLIPLVANHDLITDVVVPAENLCGAFVFAYSLKRLLFRASFFTPRLPFTFTTVAPPSTAPPPLLSSLQERLLPLNGRLCFSRTNRQAKQSLRLRDVSALAEARARCLARLWLVWRGG